MDVRRGDIFLVNLDPVLGSEQGKTRPAVIIQNDVGNKYSPTTIVAPITSKIFSHQYLTNVEIMPGKSGLQIPSTILLNQIRTVDKQRLIKRLGEIDVEAVKCVDKAIMVSLGLK